MGLELMFKAFLLGVLMASPIGPVGLLCLKKNAAHDRRRGLFTALGMAIAYGIISFCVLFGMKWVSGMLETYRCPLEIIAGCILIYMGWQGIHTGETPPNESASKTAYATDFASSFAMTLFNPVPFATFAVTITTLKILKGQLNLIQDIEFSLLVATGTMTFWLVVNQTLHHVKKNSTSDWCRWISHGAGVALLVFGLAILVSGFYLAFTLVME